MGIADHQIAGLGVQEHVVGIFRLFLGEVMLPVLVGQPPVGNVSFEMKPAIGKGQCPVLWQSQPHLRYRPSVDA